MIWGATTAQAAWVAIPSLVDLLVPVSHPMLQWGVWVGGSACVALWPDIDEPSSKASTVARSVGAIGGGVIASVIPLADSSIVIRVIIGFLLGGIGTSVLILPLLRILAGGHRRATHSLVSALACFLIMIGLFILPVWAPWMIMIVGWIGWGIIAHILPDLTTPAGVPLFYPVRSTSIRIVVIPEWVTGVIGIVGFLLAALYHSPMAMLGWYPIR